MILEYLFNLNIDVQQREQTYNTSLIINFLLFLYVRMPIYSNAFNKTNSISGEFIIVLIQITNSSAPFVVLSLSRSLAISLSLSFSLTLPLSLSLMLNLLEHEVR